MCQHNSTTTQQRVSKTAQQENKRAMNSRRQDFSTSVIQSVRQSVRTAVSTEVRQSDAFSGLQHPTGLFVLTGFVPDAGFGNGMIRLFRLAGEQAGTGRAIRPVFESPKHLCFGTRQAVFSVTRNRFRNRKQLARKGGWKTPPKSSLFTGHPVCQPEFQFFKMSSPSPPAICSTGARKRAETKTKTRGRRPLRRSEPATIPHKKSGFDGRLLRETTLRFAV